MRVTHTSPYLWMVGLTVLWLLIPRYLGATAIALIRTPDEIVAAADSKQTIDVLLPGFVSSRDVCKIHKIRDNFYFATAGYRGVVDPLTGKAAGTPQGEIFTVEQAVLRSHKADLSIRENIDIWERSITSFLSKNLGERQRNNPEHFKRNFSILSKSDVVVFGIERELMVVHHLQFRAQHEPRVTIIATRRMCPGDCEDPAFVPIFLGEREAMETKYSTETRFSKNDGLAKNAQALVDAAIAANPKAVGGPIDILRISREKSSWITVKPECRQ
ncbi:MAG TPA: hypothetical protein VJ864_08665 [Candidatus Binatia bacterium]|jgi:hypothetical protein|nr:hypothetical protein [Candidatus Binatia bacterium]